MLFLRFGGMKGSDFDFRASAAEDHASALVFADSTVHGSVVSQS